MDMNAIVGTHDIVFVTLDTLRFDVSKECFEAEQTPNFKQLFPSGWERRHTPASFTYAAHHAFFAGFLPTPATPGRHPRLFATRFPGASTVDHNTRQFDASNWVTGLAEAGYHTICIGGTGFFNPASKLGQVLPALFAERHWSPNLGVTNADSTENQFRLASTRLGALSAHQRTLLFINVAALHQPNHMYLDHNETDSRASQAAALAYVDRQLPILLQATDQRGPTFWIVCSDHGTAYGEDGYEGHRVGHSVVWTVPFATCCRPGAHA
jgi:hypothetical protein